MKDLLFQRDSFGRYIGSPYDNFLRVNHLPAAAADGRNKGGLQSAALSAGSRRSRIRSTSRPTMARCQYHSQPYQFGALELQGLKIFLASAAAGAVERARGQLCRVSPGAGLFGLCLPQQRGLAGGIRRRAMGRALS